MSNSNQFPNLWPGCFLESSVAEGFLPRKDLDNLYFCSGCCLELFRAHSGPHPDSSLIFLLNSFLNPVTFRNSSEIASERTPETVGQGCDTTIVIPCIVSSVTRGVIAGVIRVAVTSYNSNEPSSKLSSLR